MTETQIAALESARFLKSGEEVRAFESTLSEIAKADLTRNDAERLYGLFEDSSAQQDVLWGLLHLIEDVDQTISLTAFVAVLPQLKEKSPEWADTITARVLNGNHSSPIFRSLLLQEPRSRAAVLPILKDLSGEQNPRLEKLRRSAEELLEDFQ